MLKWARLSVGKLVYKARYLTVKINSVIGFIDYTPSLLKLVQFCCLCDSTEIRSECTPVIRRAAAYYSLRN